MQKKSAKSSAKFEDEGEAMDVDKTDNVDIGADVEDKDMASQEEQDDEGVVRERTPQTSTPVPPAPASTYFPYQYQPDNDKIKPKKRKAASSLCPGTPLPLRAVLRRSSRAIRPAQCADSTSITSRPRFVCPHRPTSSAGEAQGPRKRARE